MRKPTTAASDGTLTPTSVVFGTACFAEGGSTRKIGVNIRLDISIVSSLADMSGSQERYSIWIGSQSLL